MNMHGTVALVTGGASGIGAATAVAFAERGADVVIADVDADGGERTARDVRELGVQALFVRCSVADETAVAELMNEVRGRFGRLDYAHNNAGVEQRRARITDTTEQDWNRVIATNLTGVWLSMKHELLALTRPGGAIVNTSSVVGLVGAPGASAYVATKHGIVGLTRAAALEVADEGIRVNAVCPGHISTPMVDRVLAKEPHKAAEYQSNTPLGRLASSHEVARAVVWLCSPEASFITGAAVPVDGGVIAK